MNADQKNADLRSSAPIRGLEDVSQLKLPDTSAVHIPD